MQDNILLKELSEAIARGIDSGDKTDLLTNIKILFNADMSREDKEEALKNTYVYSIAASRPGEQTDGNPGYLAPSANLKQAILEELSVMKEADFNGDLHAKAWAELIQSINAAPESDFNDGVEVNCPDDYILSLNKLSCLEALEISGINLFEN